MDSATRPTELSCRVPNSPLPDIREAIGSRPGRKPKGTFAVLIACVACACMATHVFGGNLAAPTGYALDANGCRLLGEAPAAGVHPRVFFNADELPRIRRRMETTTFGRTFRKTVLGVVGQVKNQYANLAELGAGDIPREVIEKHMKPAEGRNIQWGVASVYAAAYEDKELAEFMARVIAAHGRILLASKELGIGGPARLWDTTNYTVGESWTIGAAGLAVSYDVLFNTMTDAQRAVVREAIATATAGRTPYGSGLPRGFAASNHYGYHGDLAVLLCAIEGEEGFDKPTYERIRRILLDYWDVGYTDLGAAHEDAYMQLGLRAGSRGLLALARRGDNVFATAKYRNYLEYVALEFEPFPRGAFVGGASLSMVAELYPTCILVGRYMYPRDPAANYAWRHTVGDDYDRPFRWQAHLGYLLFGGDWRGPAGRERMLAESGLPRARFYPVRGKLVARSDWSTDALQFTLDARPDAFLIGHDKVDRGHFTLSALGRNWAANGSFHKWQLSDENSLVHIDGKAQGWKAPSVRFVAHRDTPLATTGSADLKYAYDWQWSPPWPSKDKAFPEPWAPERSDPRDLGWPREHAPGWLPEQIYASKTGYRTSLPAGNWMRRRPYNPVLRARRATALVRGRHPYAIVADDIQKDDGEHTYAWYMQVPADLELIGQDGGDFILGETAGGKADGNPGDEKPGRRLLVRVLQADATAGGLTGRMEAYVAHVDKRRNTKTHARRLILQCRAVAPAFKIMLLPHVAGEALPTTAWKTPGRALSVRWPEEQHLLTFAAEGDAWRIRAGK